MGSVIVGEVTAGQAYAAFIEYGTSRHRAFPFLVPALDELEGEIVSDVSAALRNAAA
jgi:hypothetical protein